MDRLIFLPSAALALGLILLYAYRCWRHKQAISVAILVRLILQSTWIVGGALLILSTFLPELRSRLADLDTYFLISGIAVLFVSAQGLFRDLRVTAPAQVPGAAHPAAPQIVAAIPDSLTRKSG